MAPRALRTNASLSSVSDDVLGCISRRLFDPLAYWRFGTLQALASTCHSLCTALCTEVQTLRKEHCAARALCRRTGASFEALAAAHLRLRLGKHLGGEHWATLSNLLCRHLLHLRGLRLNFNHIGDDGMKAFASAIASGSLRNLIKLSLYDSQIDDTCMIAFAEALKPTDNFPMGSLRSLTSLSLRNNNISDPGMIAFSEALGNGSMGKLRYLYLQQNQIGDSGMVAFSEALGSGSMGALTTLSLYSNNIGDQGMIAFSEAIGNGSMVLLNQLVVMGNPCHKASGRNACRERGITCYA